MAVYSIAVGGFAALALAGGMAWWRMCALQRVLRLERAMVRLTDAARHRDMAVFRRRIDAAIAEQRVLEAADRIVDDELARTTRHNPQEEDTP
ncbi:hypothetical protein [Streptomyces sp. sk2.1]|uniref:hypothetical protein n=1 Tax=Streptomyces sp. sk2.1 TaxID=2478959 RepID=UPI0011E70794|nr:hypothetical protein [Streptomyces sp. sk2.1]TXS68910.1 hypothetical protein EAO76_26450 [Streptomyces sp. sk2.1]